MTGPPDPGWRPTDMGANLWQWCAADNVNDAGAPVGVVAFNDMSGNGRHSGVQAGNSGGNFVIPWNGGVSVHKLGNRHYGYSEGFWGDPTWPAGGSGWLVYAGRAPPLTTPNAPCMFGLVNVFGTEIVGFSIPALGDLGLWVGNPPTDGIQFPYQDGDGFASFQWTDTGPTSYLQLSVIPDITMPLFTTPPGVTNPAALAGTSITQQSANNGDQYISEWWIANRLPTALELAQANAYLQWRYPGL